MSDAKHSRAPWSAGQAAPKGSDFLWDALFDADGNLVAYVNDCNDVPVLLAAPQLLAALKACELAMDTAAMSGVGDILAPSYRDSWAAAHTAARDALAKAQGKG
jgi:hypothetical protein